MKNYVAEVEAFEAGLEHCPEDDSLKKGLQMAKRIKTASSKATQASLTSDATRSAALSRSHKATAAKDISSFVGQTKMNLQLQMVTLQAQLDLVKEISFMAEGDKIDLLYSLLTKVMGGEIEAVKLTDSLKQASQSLSFAKDIRKALDAVGTSSQILDREAFENFSNGMISTMNVSAGDFCEFVVYQVLFTGFAQDQQIEAEKKAAIEDMDADKSILNDKRMQSLFILFDKDADATVGFKEVAIGLYQLTKSMEDAKKDSAALLLMMDIDDKRVLSYEKFAKLIMGTAATFEMTFDELADQLTEALTNPSEISEEVMKEILVAESAYEEQREKQKEETERKKTLDALSYSRTQKLFDLWDTNGDGDIDFPELMSGLRRYQKAAQAGTTHSDVERDAVKIMGYDKDSNQTLDKEEFAYAMANYAEAVKKDLHEMIDFMVVVSSQTASANEYEATYAQTTMTAAKANFKTPTRFASDLGTILDMEADEDSEAEDDW